MRVPLRWLRSLVDIPATETPRAIADRLTRVGLEVEMVEEYVVSGPLVVGRVLDFVEEPQKNGKTIRWCQVDVGAHNPVDDSGRGIVCGAPNFAVGDLVVVILAGGVLPGGFEVSARKTYGHLSDGMICSVRELGVGDDHEGIYVIPPDVAATVSPGDDAAELMGLPDAVLDIAVTPDRGYCLSMRGVAREAATAYGVAFHDPADVELPGDTGTPGHPVSIADPTGADRIVLRRVSGFDPNARSPLWLQTRLHLAGMRPISLAVDVTNYVMLELGQPLHAFDEKRLQGELVVRRAAVGEHLTTLDGQTRQLDPDDLLITDSSGPIAIAGTMGGATTEIDGSSTELVIEAAHFMPVTAARQSKRHKLSTEASRRFERGVDPQLPPVASARACALLIELGTATYVGVSEVDDRADQITVRTSLAHSGQVAGVDYAPEVVRRRLVDVGCAVSEASEGLVEVTPPSWRPDLTDPNDLAEEVIRLEGYDRVPSVLRPTPPGRGVGTGKRHALMVARTFAGAGLTEVRCYPFVGEQTLDALGIPDDDERRRLVRLANPLSDEEPYLRSGLMQALVPVAQRNVRRGFTDLAIYEIGRTFRARPGAGPAPRPPVDRRPTPQEIEALDAALPDQPIHVAAVLTGQLEATGWWGEGRSATWADAVELARQAASSIDAPLVVRGAQRPPWHPGRCAELLVDISGDGTEPLHVGYAGELAPKVCEAFGLPDRSVGLEVDLTTLAAYAEDLDTGPSLSTFPIAKEDVALVVAEEVTAADLEGALRAGAGGLLESLRLFDVYRDERLGDGRKSMAYALRFRAPDRTLTVEEASAAKDAAVAEAQRLVGAVLRS